MSRDYHIEHTISHASGWQLFGDVTDVAGNRGDQYVVACAGVNGELHVCASTGEHLWHALCRMPAFSAALPPRVQPCARARIGPPESPPQIRAQISLW